MLNIDLSGKVAVVTGATGELGRVMARTLAVCGADVAVHYFRKRDEAHALADEIRALGRASLAVQADVTVLEEVYAMADAVRQALGRPADICVNNAVSQYHWTSVLEQAPEDFTDQFRSCVLQTVHMAKAFVPGMRAQRWGRLVVINTECAMQCHPHQAAYASAKRGLDGVVRVLAKEIGAHGITVNQVAPGWTISDRVRAEGTEEQQHYSQHVPLQRRGTDQEIANAVAFLASNLASFITGAYLPVCGGNVMPGI
jgi:3-oxoacyl-[acyl-carrier protein] reductase